MKKKYNKLKIWQIKDDYIMQLLMKAEINRKWIKKEVQQVQ